MKKLMLVFVLLMSVACLVFSGGGTVSAQEQKEESGKKKEAFSDEFILEEVIVTANRIESEISKTPATVSAILGDDMVKEGYSDLMDLNQIVPGLNLMHSGNWNGVQATIRGITSTDMTEKGDTSVAFMMDDIYISRPNMQEGAFFDIARVEVLRGPQGTLYGRNTTAGVINVISNKPTAFKEFEWHATIGNYGTYMSNILFNMPLTENQGFRGSVSYTRQDSFTITPYFNNDPFKDNISTRLQYMVYLKDNITLLLKADYDQEDGSRGYSSALARIYDHDDIVAAGLDGPEPEPIKSLYDVTDAHHPVYLGGFSSDELRTNQNGYWGRQESYTDNYNWGISADLNWDFGPVMLTYLGSYRQMNIDSKFGFDSLTGAGTPALFEGEYWQQQHEARIATTGEGRFQFQGGVYYFHEHSGIALMFLPGYIWGFPQDPTVNDSLAFYGQGVTSITDKLRLTTGLRWSRDFKSRKGYTQMWYTARNDAERTDRSTDWRLGLDYDLTDDTLLYGYAATAYKAGGFNDGCLEGSSPECVGDTALPAEALFYDPEEIMTYEIGLKTKYGANFRLNTALFYSEFEGMQLAAMKPLGYDPDTGDPFYGTVTGNAAMAISKGVEIEGTWMPTTRNQITFNIAYLDAEFDDYLAVMIEGTDEEGEPIVYSEDYSGRPLDNSPKWAYNVGYAYRYPLASGAMIEASAHWQHSNDYVASDYAAVAQYYIPGYNKIDLGLGYTAPEGKWYVKAFAKNITDEISFNRASYNGLGFADPFTYGIRFGYRYD